MSDMPALRATDPEIHRLIALEAKREAEFIRLIPSENYASDAVMEATGSILANKYSEGYPGKRYYEGQDYIDQVESLAIERAKSLFGMQHANVQPYSGSPANQAVYLALAKPGEHVMGLGLPFGGHLTHGWGVNFSGIVYRADQYEVDPETHRVDLNRVEALAKKTRPKLIFCGGTAYPRTWDYAGFAQIAQAVGAVIDKRKMKKHFALTIADGRFAFRRREEEIAAEARLDGVYVIRTSLPKEKIGPEAAVSAYKSLAHVERAFRTLKGVDLAVRPVFHWLDHRVKAHVFLCMLAYYVEHHMRNALAPILFADHQPQARERASIVRPARPSAGAASFTSSIPTRARSWTATALRPSG